MMPPLKRIFEPRRIAVIGASNQPGKVGHIVFRNLVGQTGEHVVYPINARQESVQGVQAYREMGAAPQAVDLAVICTPAETVPAVIEQCIAAKAGGAVVLSAGFGETGPAGRALEARLCEILERSQDFRLIGPNCLGFMSPRLRINASFGIELPAPGSVAFVSQSGALCTAVLDWASQEQLGFSLFASIGNMLDMGFAEVIDYLAGDPHTESLILYVESISKPRGFMSAARAFARRKPLIVFKAGRCAESAQVAASHTGALTGVDEVYQAAFDRAGIVRVDQVNDMLDCARLLSRRKAVVGQRLAIVTNAGGPGVIATDALVQHQGELARLSAETLAALDAILPPYWSRRNPVDLLGDATSARFREALRLVLADAEVDAALVILTPQAMTDVEQIAEEVARLAVDQPKPILAVWMGGQRVRAGIARLNAAQVPTYEFPEKAIRAFTYLVAHGRHQVVLHETPRDIALPTATAPAERSRWALEAFRLPGQTSAALARRLLALYGIPLTPLREATSAEEAVRVAGTLGYPVVMKIHSPQILHKTEVEGVALDLADAEGVARAYARLLATARARRPDAELLGVTLEPMVSSPTSMELILGAKKDPVFGPVIMIGLGGIAAEVHRDYALGLPPLNERLAWRMLESLRCWPLLAGFRGRPAMNREALLQVLLRFSMLLAECPQVLEFDVNPLHVTPEGVLALDARCLADVPAVQDPPRRYGHLAIRPYPAEWIRRVTLGDGQPFVLRPIRPEDEPMWHDLMSRCSPRSLHFRFHYLFKKSTHEMAARFCYVDYDREMAIVAETPEPARQLVAVGRLIADPEHRNAEFAVLVADAWQRRGLGGMLLDYALEIAGAWGIRQVFGETMAENQGMIATFRSRGFELRYDGGTQILATKALAPETPAGE